MSQVSDVVLDNQGFSSFRTELNNILGALNTSHVGGSAPSSVATGTIWVDSGTSGFLKIKINDGSDNIELFSINISSNSVSSTASSGGTDWQTVKTASFTAVAGEGYFVNTSGGVITLTLPSSASIGDEVKVIDYAGSFGTNNLTIGRNSHKIMGATSDLTVGTNRAGFGLVYVDATQGWLLMEK